MTGEKQDNVWALPAFYFKVEIEGIDEIAFKEVSGLAVELETEEVEEGGETRFQHRVPVRKKHGNLVCRRGLYPLKESALSKWVSDILEGDFSKKIEPKNVFVSLLNAEGDKLCGWFLTNVFPVKWSIEPFNPPKNELTIETIEFAYNTIERK